MPNEQQRWNRDYEVEEKTHGRITAAFLRKDRIGRQLIPFHRLGRLCLYDIAEVNAAIEAMRVGGVKPKPQRAKA